MTWWAALGSIILINIVLSGDNAVVIAMAARRLPENQRNKAIFWGSAAAIGMRIILTLVAVELMKSPYLKIVGALLLLYIGIQLLADGDDGEDDTKHRNAHGGIAAAIRTILIADLVMSLDNVLGVAAAAKGNQLLLIIGLAISIPLIIFGSTLLMKVMDRLPIIITLGAALLGFLAGEMFVSDPVDKKFFESLLGGHFWQGLIGIEKSDAGIWAGLIGAAIVVAVGSWLAKRHNTHASA